LTLDLGSIQAKTLLFFKLSLPPGEFVILTLPSFILTEKATLAFGFIGLFAKSVFFFLLPSLFFSKFRSSQTSFLGLILHLFLLTILSLLAKFLLKLKLLFLGKKFHSITFGSEAILLFTLFTAFFIELSSGFRLGIFSLLAQTILFFLQVSQPSGFLFIVGSSVKLRLVLQFLLLEVVGLFTTLAVFHFLKLHLASSFVHLRHLFQVFLLLSQAAFLFESLSFKASLFFLLFGFKSQPFSFFKLLLSLEFGSLLLLALFLKFLAETFLFFLLLLDSSKIVLLRIILFFTTFHSFCLFIVFGINLCVVLVLATTALALVLSLPDFFVVIHRSQQVALLPALGVEEFLGTHVSLNTFISRFLLDGGLSVDVVILLVVHVLFTELELFAVVICQMLWCHWPSNDLARILLFGPTRSQLYHTLAPSVTKVLE